MKPAAPSSLAYCCPRCKGLVAANAESYLCESCQQTYPVVLGIPDFRVFPDPYISLDDDRRKARRIAESGGDFRALNEFYWSITPEEPRDMAARFVAQALAGAERGRHLLNTLSENEGLRFEGAAILDLGTRTGGLLLAAAERTDRTAVGIDIALRWLIVARQRMLEAGLPCQLVCCCAEYLPFVDETFDLVVAENVLEHTARQQRLVKEAHRVTRPGGTFFTSTWNRLAAAPEPHVRLWGVGWLPLAWRRSYVKRLKGVSYDHVRLISAFELRRLTRQAGFAATRIILPEFSPAQLAQATPVQRRILGLYHRLKDLPVIRSLLLVLAPVLHQVGRRDANRAEPQR